MISDQRRPWMFRWRLNYNRNREPLNVLEQWSSSKRLLWCGCGSGLVTNSNLTLATPWTVAHQAPLSMEHSSKNTGMGYHFLLQGIFPIQESNPGLLHCRQTLYQLSYATCSFLRYIKDFSCVLYASLLSGVQLLATPWTVCNLPGSSIHDDFPGKNTRVSCHAILQGVFPTQGSNPGTWHGIPCKFFTVWATREVQRFWQVTPNHLLTPCKPFPHFE